MLCWERKTSWKYLYNHHQRVVLESYDFPSTLILVSVILLPQVTNNSIPEKLPSVVKGTNGCTSRHKVILWRIFENLLKCDTVDPLPSFYTTKEVSNFLECNRKVYQWYPGRSVPLWFSNIFDFVVFFFRSILYLTYFRSCKACKHKIATQMIYGVLNLGRRTALRYQISHWNDT
mgnify:CR=1 FL=1